MNDPLAQRFREGRECLGLSVAEVAQLAGYVKRLQKTVRRIEKLERTGVGGGLFLERVFAAVGLSLSDVRNEIEAELSKEREEWITTWLDGHGFEKPCGYFVVKLLPGFYSAPALPTYVRTASGAVEHLRHFTRKHHLQVCLPLTGDVAVYFDRQGAVEGIADRPPCGPVRDPRLRRRSS